MLLGGLTCRGLQKQQGDEAADRDDATLHGGGQETSHSPARTIYTKEGRLKGRRAEGAGPGDWQQLCVCGGVIAVVSVTAIPKGSLYAYKAGWDFFVL